MKRSTDRIVTTHAGSLPRPADWLAMTREGAARDAAALAARGRIAVADIVRKQVEIGIDVISDGEQGKPSFVSYVNERLAGFEPAGRRESPWAGSRETIAFPEYYDAMARANAGGSSNAVQMACVGPISYCGQAELERDIENFTAALKGVRYGEAFLPAISPANIETWHVNRHYKTEEEYLFAIAEAMGHEYRAIVAAGFLLQIDDPRLATYYVLTPNATIPEVRKWAEVRVEALNHALKGIPQDRVRYHTCYSINMGPRLHDMEMKDLVRVMLKIRAGAYSFEAANPRHDHEWALWETVKLAPGKSLVPGVISHTTVLVEHPELVAQRIGRYALMVGRDNVIAGADCGFATFAGSQEVHPTIAWAKLEALVKGARLASKELWPKRRKAAARRVARKTAPARGARPQKRRKAG
jgi:5-methyltetrahydropteroyltriglutamate--homocysteine methyltransferase